MGKSEVPNMALDFNTAFGVHEKALGLRSDRLQLIASNLANADTPGYKARDIDFQAAMQAAMSGASSGLALAQTQQAHQSGQAVSELNGLVQYRTPTQPSLDGNTVDAQQEEAVFSRNAVDYQASFTFLNNAIKNMLTAIRGS